MRHFISLKLSDIFSVGAVHKGRLSRRGQKVCSFYKKREDERRETSKREGGGGESEALHANGARCPL
jgi:hypothetical protein